MLGLWEYGAALALVAWLSFSAVGCYGTYYYLRYLPAPVQHSPTALAVVIIPIRGASSHFAQFWAALVAQNYDRWRVMFVVESETDPVCAAITTEVTRMPPPRPIEIVVAGPATKSSQLNHNCLAALGRLRSEDEIVVFAAVDMIPAPDWLARTIQTIGVPGRECATAYPFMIPDDGRLSTAASCALNHSLAYLPRVPKGTNVAWGGTMALRRHTLDQLDLSRWWSDTISNDCTMTRAVWEKGGAVSGGLVTLIPSRESMGWIESIHLWRRWYLNIRLYLPRRWLVVAVGSLVPIAGWAAVIPLAIDGSPAAIGVLGVAVGLHHWRATLRRWLRLTLSPGHDDRVMALADRWGAPVWCVLRAVIIWSVLFMRTARWAGRVYRVDGPHRIRVIDGPAAS